MSFNKGLSGDPYVISMADIAGVTHYLGKPLKSPTTDQLLYLAGMDVSKGYDTAICLHRPITTNRLVTCERFVGIERTDELWVALQHRLKSPFSPKNPLSYLREGNT